MELEHLLAEWSVRHKVCTDIPWYHIRIHGLQIAFTCLIVNRIVNQCILGECGTQSRHNTRELLLIETRVHGKNIMIERRIQSQVTHGLIHRIGVITHRFHLLNSRLAHTTTVVDTCELFATELIFEVHIWRPIESIVQSITLYNTTIVGLRLGLSCHHSSTSCQIDFLAHPTVVQFQLL